MLHEMALVNSSCNLEQEFNHKILSMLAINMHVFCLFVCVYILAAVTFDHNNMPGIYCV